MWTTPFCPQRSLWRPFQAVSSQQSEGRFSAAPLSWATKSWQSLRGLGEALWVSGHRTFPARTAFLPVPGVPGTSAQAARCGRSPWVADVWIWRVLIGKGSKYCHNSSQSIFEAGSCLREDGERWGERGSYRRKWRGGEAGRPSPPNSGRALLEEDEGVRPCTGQSSERRGQRGLCLRHCLLLKLLETPGGGIPFSFSFICAFSFLRFVLQSMHGFFACKLCYDNNTCHCSPIFHRAFPILMANALWLFLVSSSHSIICHGILHSKMFTTISHSFAMRLGRSSLQQGVSSFPPLESGLLRNWL